MVADDPESFADLDGHISASVTAPPVTPSIPDHISCPPGMPLCEDQKKDPPPQEQNQNQQEQCAQYGCGGGTPRSPGIHADITLPNDPTGLGKDWTKDDTHKNPNGEKWVNPNGDVLEWHRGQPGKTGEKGKDHWHWRPGGKKLGDHLNPGDTIKTYGPAAVKAAATVAVGVVVIRVLITLAEAALAF